MKQTIVEYQIETILRLKKIILEDFHEKYQELHVLENKMPYVAVGEYMTWIRNNIPLDPNNMATIELYAVLYNRPVEAIRRYAERQSRSK